MAPATMQLDNSTRALTTETLRRSCKRIGCENTALWIAHQDHLTPVIGHGPHADLFIETYKQPLTEGIISMVYASGQPFCENNIRQNPHHSTRLDELLGIHTVAMIVAPVANPTGLIGVITAVHTSPKNTPESIENPHPTHNFTPQDMAEAEYAAAIIGRILQ